jgi:two-component system, NarL family, sensor histidine kinase UhpB
MAFKLKDILAKGPEAIDAEKVLIRELPLEELGLTFLYILVAGLWEIFADQVIEWIMGRNLDSPVPRTLRAINFITTSALVLYLVLRRTLRSRRQALEALRLSQQRFEFVALATTDAVWDLNLETKVVWWSEGVQKLFGYRSEDVSSQSDWWLQRVHPEDRERVTASIRKAVEDGGHNWKSEYRFRRQDERYAFVLGRGYIIRDAFGKPVRLVGGLSDVSEQRMAEQAIENSRQQLRALNARLQSGREDERAKVAREIHDDLGQLLTAIKINLDWLERQLGETAERATANAQLERVVESEEMIEAAIQSVQRIAADLRPAVLDNLGLAEALEQEVGRFQERTGISCEMQLPSEALSLRPETSLAIFRVLQEALTNVARHAHASVVRISLASSNEQVVLLVEDNGEGIRAEAIGDPRSLGLLGMSERASALGGHVSVAPVMPHGTRVTLQLPETNHAAPHD